MVDYGLDNSNKQSEGKINNSRKIFSSNSKQNICQNKYIEDLTPIQGFNLRNFLIFTTFISLFFSPANRTQISYLPTLASADNSYTAYAELYFYVILFIYCIILQLPFAKCQTSYACSRFGFSFASKDETWGCLSVTSFLTFTSACSRYASCLFSDSSSIALEFLTSVLYKTKGFKITLNVTELFMFYGLCGDQSCFYWRKCLSHCHCFEIDTICMIMGVDFIYISYKLSVKVCSGYNYLNNLSVQNFIPVHI